MPYSLLLVNTFFIIKIDEWFLLFYPVLVILQRLKIAREFGDKAAERRANSNLGNSHIFLGEFEAAAEHYK